MLNPFKTGLSVSLGLSKDALHVHLGLLAFLLAVALLRKSPASAVPWLCVFALESINEILDFIRWHDLPGFFSGTFKDVVNTMLWPTVILLISRFSSSRRSPSA